MKNEERYTRQTTLKEVGQAGQTKLEQAKVLVIGAGGLGCALLPYLVTAGVGTIGIVDGDLVTISNLHRQVLFSNQDVEKQKATIASQKLRKLNPEIQIETYPFYLNGNNALDLIKKYDLVVDATDRISARYLINDACVLADKPFVHSSIYKFQLQLSVFNYKDGPTYRCLYPQPDENAKSCAEVGVMGTTVALAGSLQANEVIKMILEIGKVRSGELLIFDLLSNEQSTFSFKKNSSLKITQETFQKEHIISKVSYAYAEMNDHLLIDVRETSELPILKANHLLQMPMSVLESSLELIPMQRRISLFCQSGERSLKAYKTLKSHQFKDVYCLEENAPQLEKILSE